MRALFQSASMRRRILLGGGGATLLASLYALTRRGAAPEGPAAGIRIAVPVVPHAGLIHIASARGFFRDRGLAVTLLPQT